MKPKQHLAHKTRRLKQLAKQIRDDAHLDRVLNAIEDFQMRRAVRNLLTPMLSFKPKES